MKRKIKDLEMQALSLTDRVIDLEVSVKEKCDTIDNQHKRIFAERTEIDDKKAANLVSIVQCLLH